MKKCKIAFVDFWHGFIPQEDEIFGNFFGKHFNVEYTLDNPDLVFFSMFGKDHLKYNQTKILYSGENYFFHKYHATGHKQSNVWKFADYVISHFDYGTDKDYVMPNWVRKYGFDKLNKELKKPQVKFNNTKKFATYIQSDCSQKFREKFFQKLNEYKKIDCPAKCNQNMPHIGKRGRTHKNKIEFCKDYKFVIAFENSSSAMYNTEKIIDPYLSGSIPLYRGDSEVRNVINTNAMINYHDFNDMDRMIDRIIEVDNNENLYNEIKAQPILADNDTPILSEEKFMNFIEPIILDHT